MRAIVRQGALLAVAALLSWWFLLRVPPAPLTPRARLVPAPVLDVIPLIREPAPIVAAAELVAHAPRDAAAPAPADTRAEERLLPPEAAAVIEPLPEPAATPPPKWGTTEEELPDETASAPASDPPGAAPPAGLALTSENATASSPPPAPPPPEIGAPEGLAQDESGSSGEPTEPLAPEERAGDNPSRAGTPPTATGDEDAAPRTERPSVETLMHDPDLLDEARAEFTRGDRKGFTTVLLAAPEDQITIARFFGEELVLVPRSALDPGTASPAYFRVTDAGEPRVETVVGPPPLAGFRQYRDLFDYEYRHLPAALRDLRRSVPARTEIYLFAALLSAEEWALVIARRQAALALADRELADVRRFVLRYLQRPEGGFDLAVDEIVFTDGTRFRPAVLGHGD